MQYRTKRIEVGDGVHRLVEFAFTNEPGKAVISMRYEGRQLNPFVIYGPVVIDTEKRASEFVQLLTRWLYDGEVSTVKSKK